MDSRVAQKQNVFRAILHTVGGTIEASRATKVYTINLSTIQSLWVLCTQLVFSGFGSKDTPRPPRSNV